MPREIMTRVEGLLFTMLLVMVLGWFFCVNRLSHQLRDRHPDKYDEMRLAEMSPRNLLEWLSRYDNSRPVMALLGFLWRGEDAELHDSGVRGSAESCAGSSVSTSGCSLTLVVEVVHRTTRDIASWGRGTGTLQ